MHARADRVHLRLERDDHDVALIAIEPGAHVLGFEQRLAVGLRIGARLTDERRAEHLLLVDGQRRARLEALCLRRPRAFVRMHAVLPGDGTVEHPRGQRRVRQRLAGVDVFLHPLRDLLPARRLPAFERPLVPAEAPADREIDIARVVRDRFEMHGDVVEHVAENCPQELRLLVVGFAQQLEALGGRTLQNAADEFVGLRAAIDVMRRLRVEHLDRLAFLAIKTRAGLLAERAVLHQCFEHGRRLVDGEERIVEQVVLHRLDDVRHRVETDDIRRAERRGFRAAEARAGEVVDFVEAQAELFGFRDHRENRKHADAVRDEVRRVLRAHDALADHARQEGFELVEDFRASCDSVGISSTRCM